MKSDKIITILTASFNRRKYLERLYNSLVNQESQNFLWLIIDDGSTDNTKEYIESLQTEKKIQIEYLLKENGGKHTAVNFGMKYVNTPLVMIVDSDDSLLPNAVSEIERINKRYWSNQKLCGYTFLMCFKDGSNVVGLDKDEFIANYIRYRIRGNRPGDMAEVFRTDVLRKFPFREYAGEKFLSEDTAWIAMGEQYDTLYINIPIYQCEYLEGGLTNTDKKMKFSSPLGSMHRGKMLMEAKCGLICNFKGAIIYNCYKHNLNKSIPSELAELSGREKLLVFITKPFGIIFYRKWESQFD